MAEDSEEKKPGKRIYEMAAELDTVLTAMSACLEAFKSFINLGNEPIMPLAERIHYQAGALEMADELAAYTSVAQSSISHLQRHLINAQERATIDATKNEN